MALKTLNTSPAFIRDMFGRDALPTAKAASTGPGIMKLTLARTAITDAWAELANDRNDAIANKSYSDFGRAGRGVAAISTHAKRALGKTAECLKLTREEAAGMQALGEAKMRAAAKVDLGLASEIRQALRTLSPAERTQAVFNTLKDGDTRIAMALLDAPDIVTGLGTEQRALANEGLVKLWAQRCEEIQGALELRHGADIVEADVGRFKAAVRADVLDLFKATALTPSPEAMGALGFDLSDPATARSFGTMPIQAEAA